MTTVNLKGGYTKSLSVTQNHSNESTTMLKQSSFLKITQNYVVQLGHFFTSAASPINTFTGPHFAIRRLHQYLGGGFHVFHQDFPDYYQASDYEFSGTFHTATEFMRALQRWLHRFGWLFQKMSVPQLLGALPAPLAGGDRATTNLNFFREFPEEKAAGGFDDVGWGTRPDAANLVNVTLDTDSRVQFILEPIFAQNFYIEVSTHMQQMLGLSDSLFHIVDGGGALYSNESANNVGLYDDLGAFLPVVNNRVANTVVYSTLSDYSLRNIDTRMTLDVTCTFPASSKISSVNGVEQREYVLARFWLNDVKKLETICKFTDEGFSSVSKLREFSALGLEDLTRGNPNTESNFLLPGSIRLVKLKLETRYHENGQIVVKPTEVGSGFWTLKLLFTKKV